MKLEYLKPGMVIVTKEFLIADIYEDRYNTLKIELRHPERSHIENPETIEPLRIDEVYDEDDIRILKQIKGEIGTDSEENMVQYYSDLKYDRYEIFMVFERSYKSSHNADTLEDLFRTRELLWLKFEFDFACNILSDMHQATVKSVYKDKGLNVEFTEIKKVKPSKKFYESVCDK